MIEKPVYLSECEGRRSEGKVRESCAGARPGELAAVDGPRAGAAPGLAPLVR